MARSQVVPEQPADERSSDVDGHQDSESSRSAKMARTQATSVPATDQGASMNSNIEGKQDTSSSTDSGTKHTKMARTQVASKQSADEKSSDVDEHSGSSTSARMARKQVASLPATDEVAMNPNNESRQDTTVTTDSRTKRSKMARTQVVPEQAADEKSSDVEGSQHSGSRRSAKMARTQGASVPAADQAAAMNSNNEGKRESTEATDGGVKRSKMARAQVAPKEPTDDKSSDVDVYQDPGLGSETLARIAAQSGSNNQFAKMARSPRVESVTV